MAELVDALDSESSGQYWPVEVQVFSWAPYRQSEFNTMKLDIRFHKGDLPDDVKFTDSVAIDTETMGLKPNRDALCLVQLSGGDSVCHVVQLDRSTYDAPNLKAIFADEEITKIFHFARFDVATICAYLDVLCAPVYCTKIASKLCRTYTDRHGLKDLCHEILNVDISKQEQMSDWGADKLTDSQLTYAATDVLYLHKLKSNLDERLAREDRLEHAQACFEFLPSRAYLDLCGFEEPDIFKH